MPRLQVALIVIHVLCTSSWLGAMAFNLVLLFPMYRARPGGEGAELMQSQGTRAAPLLYLLIAGTAASGVALAVLSPCPLDAGTQATKLACLVLMLACHLWGSLVVWPRVFLALDAEKGRLFAVYQLSMLLSAAAGTVALVATYLGKRACA